MATQIRILIARDDGQLRRIERTIAMIEARPAPERGRQRSLLEALRSERDELRRTRPRATHAA